MGLLALEQDYELQDDEKGHDDPKLVEGVGRRRPGWTGHWKLSHARVPPFKGRTRCRVQRQCDAPLARCFR
jgi:hypothetical protein